MNPKELYELQKRIKKEMESVENFGTGLMNEKVIAASYKIMSLEQLKKMRELLCKIIELKEGYIENAKKRS